MAVYKFALVAPLLVASVSAYGNCIIKNSCGTPVYYWEDQGVYGPPRETIAPGQSWTKEMYQTGKGNGAGPSIKCAAAKADGSLPEESDPITQFEYTVNAGTFQGKASFDISNVNGGPNPPFVAGGIVASSPQDSSASKTCQAGENPCAHAYTVYNDDSATTVTEMNNDIVFDICGPKAGMMIPSNGQSGSGGNSGHTGNAGGNNSPPPATSSSAPPAPAPPASSSAAPASPPAAEEKIANQPGGSTEVVWVTQYADPTTVVVHVNAKRTDAPEAPEKREEHIHNHAHAHNKINKRRHGA